MRIPPRHTRSFVNRELLFKMLLPVAAIFIVLFVAELATHHFRPDLGWRLQKHPHLGWASAEYLAFQPAAPVDTSIIRLLFLGDSFLAGAGLTDLDQRFPLLVGERLPGAEVQILSAGGWGTDQELLAYLDKGAAWQPDFIFLCFCANNDLSNNLSNSHGVSSMMKPYFMLTGEGELRLYGPMGQTRDLSSPDREVGSTGIRSYLVDYLRFRLGKLREAPLAQTPGVDSRYQEFLRHQEKSEELYRLQPTLSWSPQSGVNHVSAFIHEDFPLNTYQWQLFEALLEQLNSSTQKQGGQLVVVLLPASYRPRDPRFIVGSPLEREFQTPEGSFTFRAAEPAERLRQVCRRLDVQLFDPSLEFRRIVEEDHLATECWPDLQDRHFTEVGHRIVAGLFIDYLRSQYPEQFATPRSW